MNPQRRKVYLMVRASLLRIFQNAYCKLDLLSLAPGMSNGMTFSAKSNTDSPKVSTVDVSEMLFGEGTAIKCSDCKQLVSDDLGLIVHECLCVGWCCM